MSRCNWLQLVTLGGFLAVTLLSESTLAKNENGKHQEETNRASYAIQQAGPNLGPIPFERREPAKPDWANPECNKPKDHDEADLCVQRQMAHTAQSSLYSNYVQIGLGVIGAGLLLWTLRYTRRATEAAAVAAKAARDSADALPNVERAYIFIEIHPNVADGIRRTLSELMNKTGYRDGNLTLSADIRYQFINHGKTPAIAKIMSIEFHHLVDLPTPISYDDEPLSQEIVIRAGETYPEPAAQHAPDGINRRFGMSPGTTHYTFHRLTVAASLNYHTARSIREGDSFLWLYGRVVYDDVFGKERKTPFCWRYHGPTNTFEQYNRGDEGLNRRT
jgi:hypothetical protein